MSDTWGFVANSFGQRSIGDSVGAGQAAASNVADSVIGSVKNILDTAEKVGDKALNDAVQAVDNLARFTPGTLTFDFDTPKFDTPGFATAPGLSGGSGSADVGVFSTSGSLPTFPTFSLGTAPRDQGSDSPNFTFDIALTEPLLQSLPSAPNKPNITSVNVPSPPSIATVAVGDFDLPHPPRLDDVSLPELVDVNFADVDPLEALAFPELPTITGPALPAYSPQRELVTTFRTVESQVDTLLIDFSVRLKNRELATGVDRWRSRGVALSVEQERAQIDFWSETSRLLAASEELQRTDDLFMIDREIMWAAVQAMRDQHRMVAFEAGTLAYLRAAFESDAAVLAGLAEIYKAVAARYNAEVSLFRAEVERYKTWLQTELAQLAKWEAQVRAEVMKGDLNRQLAETYRTQVQVETSKADLYKARVQAVAANVAAYRARMEGFAAAAEAARANLAVYQGEVQAYMAELSGYKAEFQRYAASARAVGVKNKIEEVKTAISSAKIKAAGADAALASAQMGAEAESLKLRAYTNIAENEKAKLTSAVEALKARATADNARVKTLLWGANILSKNVRYEAGSALNQAAARYYSQVSEASYRASEQAYRAILSAAQATLVAQESAGRAAASVAQGAFSALHVSASLQGSGRISGDEDRRVANNAVINDWLTYEESRQAILSA